MTDEPDQTAVWQTGDIGVAAFLAAHGCPPTSIDAAGNRLSRFSFQPSERLNELVLSWGSGATVEAARYWAALCGLKAQIRDARRIGHDYR